jgi:hypothetical protein
VVINENARVFARARSGSSWSGYTADTFVITPTALVITEIMYHPADGPAGSPYEDNDYEFLEFLNRGSTALDLTGIYFSKGMDFIFTAGAILDPGEYAVIVKNLEAFKSRYPNWQSLTILGEYSGSLENRGERLAVKGPLEETIVDFLFNDQWYPSTDGDGYSLAVVDPYDPRDPWGEKESWRASGLPMGSPGEANPGGPGPGGWQRQGDVNQDGALDISDIVGYLRLLFAGASTPLPCEGDTVNEGANLILLDLNNDSAVNVADAIWGLAFLFQEGPPPFRGTDCFRIQGCPQACGF